MVTRLIQIAVVAFAIYYLVTNPDGAAALVHGALGELLHAPSSLSSFASHL